MRGSLLVVVAWAATTVVSVNSLQAQDQKKLLARGDYLVNVVAACGGCHTQRGPDLMPIKKMNLAGGYRFDIPPGLAFSKNITPDKDTGLGSWTEEQVIRAIREGRTKEGNIIGPPMPTDFYNKMSDDDAKAIATYLRSIKPIRNPVQESKYKIPLKAEPPAKGLPAPAKTDKVAYGAYLADMAHCAECHTPLVGPKRDYEKQFMAGGFEIEIGGKLIRTLNITSDRETGIGAWTDAQIKRAITKGIDRKGKKLIPRMPYTFFQHMTSEDLNALVAYLRTVPPIKKRIEPNPSQQVFLRSKG